ncbi:hypothetical protein P7K49_033652, partial [Saguinus oedipus]
KDACTSNSLTRNVTKLDSSPPAAQNPEYSTQEPRGDHTAGNVWHCQAGWELQRQPVTSGA